MLILGAPWHCHEHWLWCIVVGHWLGFSTCLLCLDPGFRFRIIMRFTIDIIFKHDIYIYIYFVGITYPSLAQHKCKFQRLCERWWHWIWILAFYIDVGYWYVDIDIGCWVWILDMDQPKTWPQHGNNISNWAFALVTGRNSIDGPEPYKKWYLFDQNKFAESSSSCLPPALMQ